MNTVLISYDLRVPETPSDYNRIINYIKSFYYWSKPLKSLWFVKTDKSTEVIRNEIKAIIDQNDGILILDINVLDWATIGISKEVTDWMSSNI
ncbi:MAG: CRISPR-associated protein Cas2 [Candidatus Paceibacterota bacterium]